MAYQAKESFVVSTGTRRVLSDGIRMVAKTWLADTTERTAPVVCHTRNKSEAVRLTKQQAADEAKQVQGIVEKV